jgi:hypothetical protein
MSRTTDRFRPPYGMRLVESPRQCVFAGQDIFTIPLDQLPAVRSVLTMVGGKIVYQAEPH